MTMVRDKDTSRDDFIFFSERLARLVVERSLNELEFKPKSIQTPIDQKYDGLERISEVTLIAYFILVIFVGMWRVDCTSRRNNVDVFTTSVT